MNETQINQKSFSDSDRCRNEESRNAASQEKEMVKCLVCPQATQPNKFYCSEHARATEAYYESWKWEQAKHTRLKISRAVNQHLKDKTLDYICQPANCPELKEAIEKEFSCE